MTTHPPPNVNLTSWLLAVIIIIAMIPLYYFVFVPYHAFARCPNGTHKSPSGACEQVVPHEDLPRCPNGFHRSPSGICEAVNGNGSSNQNNKVVETPSSNNTSSLQQFKKYTEQYGRFSIQVPKDWTIESPHIKQDSVGVSFDPKWDDIIFTVVAGDRHETLSEADFEQVIREENAATVADMQGATLIQDTDCMKYVIDGNKACSMIYTVTYHQYTTKEMDIDFQTAKQGILVSFSGSTFDKYLPVAQQMLNSMKVS